jgi:hypothetical protein
MSPNSPSGPISIGTSSWLLGNGIVEGLILLPPGEEGTNHQLLPSNQGKVLTILTALSLSSRSFRIISINIQIFIGILVFFIIETFLGVLGMYGRELGGSLSIS